MGRDGVSPVAESVPFDNDTNGFTADDVQAAIEEAKDEAAEVASPGFVYGRSGVVNSGTWLNNEAVPSNKSGRLNYLTGSVTKISTSNEDINTYTVEAFYHDGDSINLTSLGTLSITADRIGSQDVNWAVPINKQVAVQLVSGNAKNPLVTLQITGS